MRATILIERLPTSYGSYMVGAEATQILGEVSGVTDVLVEKQFIDRAMLSFEFGDHTLGFDSIDRVLRSKGMHRV